MSLDSGERQVAATVSGIRRDHVARYEFAANILPPGSRIIDFGCGVGYGSRVMVDAGHKVTGYDIDGETLRYAKQHYGRNDATETAAPVFRMADAMNPPDMEFADAAVCFEMIEHVADPKPLLKALRLSAPALIASVPNEEVFPHGGSVLFHHQHYTRKQFADLLHECGWKITSWHGQEDHESEVESVVNGRTLVAVCSRDAIPKEKSKGLHVAILGLGESVTQYLELTKRLGGRHKLCDEVWTINALGSVFDCDLIFHMDDVRIQEIRAKALPGSNIAAMLEWMKTTDKTIITSREHPHYPTLQAFPLEDVLNTLGHDYFNSTAAYAVAYAIYRGASKITCFGMDYSYANNHHAEKGRACVEFWLGYARARGIELAMPGESTLMDANCGRDSRLYGYDTVNIRFDIDENGSVKLDFTERESLPTAEQIEANYDHSRPISEQHLREQG